MRIFGNEFCPDCGKSVPRPNVCNDCHKKRVEQIHNQEELAKQVGEMSCPPEMEKHLTPSGGKDLSTFIGRGHARRIIRKPDALCDDNGCSPLLDNLN